MSLGLDFETKLIAKRNIAERLSVEFSRKSYVPQTIALSGATDPYQPIERNLKLTRQCLEVFERFRNPVVVISKNTLMERDIDLLGRLSEGDAVLVAVSISVSPIFYPNPRISRARPRCRKHRGLFLPGARSDVGI